MPCAVVDLAAFDHNGGLMASRVTAPGLTIRVATKSLRVPELIRRALTVLGARARGLMTWSAAETRWLAEHGFDDFVLAYPVSQPHEVRHLAALAELGKTVRIMVDCEEHLALLARHLPAQSPADPESTGPGSVTLCLDIDASLRLFGDRVHLGVRRSPLHDPTAAVALADRARRLGQNVTAVMSYEAQVAGLRTRNPRSRHLDPVRRLVRERSKPVVAERRHRIVSALRAAGHPIDLVNGGGTGSLDSTPLDGSVTEVTVGSGFFSPHLFDHLEHLPLRPAAFFLLPITRFPAPGFVTASGGGYIASGPPAGDRAPIVHAPAGLSPLSAESFGEVQTPFALTENAPALGLGDPIVCRHAKAGELFERFDRVQLVDLATATALGTAETYRGLGVTDG
jgi:D-serine deaminase-like pyridoxal phosphate-dependent protein